jgi:hypothetical protein
MMPMHIAEPQKNILRQHERDAEAFSRLRINKSPFAQEAAKPWPATAISL